MYKSDKGAARHFGMIGKLIGYRQNTRHRCPYLNVIPEPYTILELELHVHVH